jgi:uncharacterized membrane protein (UPF0182 family)
MKLLAAMLMIAGSFVGAALIYAYVEFAWFTPLGFDEAATTMPVKPLVLSACSILGIVSKRLFDAATSRSKTRLGVMLGEALAPAALIRAVVACPIIMISLYPRLQELGDVFLIGLIAYQNGFFFEAVLQARGKVAVEAAGS